MNIVDTHIVATASNAHICTAAIYAPSGALVCNCPMCRNGECPVAARMDDVVGEGDFPGI